MNAILRNEILSDSVRKETATERSLAACHSELSAKRPTASAKPALAAGLHAAAGSPPCARSAPPQRLRSALPQRLRSAPSQRLRSALLQRLRSAPPQRLRSALPQRPRAPRAARLALRRMAAALLGVLALLSLLLGLPQQAAAHASLLEASPAAGARLEAAPAEVKLVFNERVEGAVGALEVLDGSSDPVTAERAKLSEDGLALTLPLPELDQGVYTVSYRIVSEDGHPIGGSYVFVIGDPPAARDASTFDVHAQLGHANHAEGGLTTASLIQYAARFLYYAALMLAAGAALWPLLYRQGWSRIADPLRGRLERMPQQALVLVALLYVFVETQLLMEGQPTSEWIRLFTATSVGQSYLALLLLAFVGLALPAGRGALRFVWALLLLATEAWSGHAAAAAPRWAALALDYVHLVFAALWAGGLMLLLFLWSAERKEAGRFAARFSRMAWISIVALTLSGIGLTLLYMTKPEYLLLTPWGILLLVKTGLVVLVAGVGFFLRSRMKRSGFPSGALLKADGALMALILVIVGVFTYISPLPANEPVGWHKMGSEMHVSIRITPNVPGDNEFAVRIWMHQSLGDPKSVKLRLQSEDKPELGAIEIPLEKFEDDEISTFEGYTKTAYRASGTYLPFAGRWTAEVRVMDKNDDERVERLGFRNY